MKITEQLLTNWGACSSGKTAFTQKFPEGAEYKEVIAACDEQGERDYRNWIFIRAFQHLDAKDVVEAETDLLPKEIEKGLEPLKALENEGVENTETVSNENEARLAASGFNSRLAASGFNSRLAASGDDSQLAASGDNSVIASAGLDSTFKLGNGGCAAIPYRDENEKIRFATAYVGENVEADIWYRVNTQGEFIKVEV